MQREHFQIFEDRVEQEIQYFSAEDVALSVGIIFDVSGSMKSKMSVARDAAVTFLKTGSPQDEHFLIPFGSTARIAHDFTSDIASLQNQLIFTPAQGMTALFDAVYLGLEKVREGTNPKKALLMITDGQDNRSRYTFRNVREFVKESDVQVYAIGIVDTYGRSQLAMGRSGRALIQELTEETGGRSFFPNSVYELEDITTKIAIELKNQYVIGYTSTNSDTDGDWREIQVKIDPPRERPDSRSARRRVITARSSRGIDPMTPTPVLPKVSRCFFGLLLLVLPQATGAQEAERDANQEFRISVDVELVQLPVSAVDRDGNPVIGLELQHFEVYEDGLRQEIGLFEHEDVPISVGLVIDNSGSMRNKRERVNSAALVFVGESNRDDETFIVNFDNEVHLEQDFTGSIGNLVDTLENIDTRGKRPSTTRSIYPSITWRPSAGWTRRPCW